MVLRIDVLRNGYNDKFLRREEEICTNFDETFENNEDAISWDQM